MKIEKLSREDIPLILELESRSAPENRITLSMMMRL